MKKIALLLVFASITHLATSQSNAKWQVTEMGHFHSLQTNGYRIPNNILLTDVPTLFNGFELSGESPAGSFTLGGIAAHELKSDTDKSEQDFFLYTSYARAFGRTTVTSGLSWIKGDVGGDYDFFSFPLTAKMVVADSIRGGWIRKIYGKVSLNYFAHRVVYDDQQRAQVAIGGKIVAGKITLSTQPSYFVLMTEWSTSKSWIELSSKIEWGNLPFFVEFTKSLGLDSRADSNYSLMLGISFAYPKKE